MPQPPPHWRHVLHVRHNTGTFKPSENSTGSFERTVIIVKELTVGDKIEGLDAEKQPALCTVEAIGMFGHGTLYGNYTKDHFVLDPATGNVKQHGAVGSRTVEDKYEATLKGMPSCGVVGAPGSVSFVVSQGKVSSAEHIVLTAAGTVVGAAIVALLLVVTVVARSVLLRRKRSPPTPATVELESGTLKLDPAAAPEVTIA